MTTAWPAPGGGLWELEMAHVQGGQPRVFQERVPRAFREGFSVAAARYGLPIDHVEVRFVNDHCYARMRPVGAPDPKPGRPSKPPPALFLKVLARMHPELRRRAKAARRAIATRLWLQDRLHWEQHQRGAMMAAARALQAEPIDELDDAALVEHLRRAAAHLEAGIACHLALVPVHNLPLGRFLLACRGWGITDEAAFALLAGCSPASTASASQLARIARACATAGVEPETLDGIRAASPDAADALDAYLAEHGWRIVTQYSPRGLALIELPEIIVQAVRAASPDTAAVPDASGVRARLGDGDRTRFDDLLADARACFGVRDDNVALNFMWPTGLLRRALLEAGRRLDARGTLHDPADVFALGEDEIAAAFDGATDLGHEAAARMARLAAAEADGAPAHLGESEGPPPDPAVFPAAMAELVTAIMLEFDLEQALQRDHTTEAAWSGEGVGVGAGAFTGRACVAPSAEDALARLRAGDVLVTTLTTPAFEAIMPIAGAVVTERGGLMSHTALVCREYGIPAVLGVAAATSHITDGATVTVDPSAGRITVQHTASPPREVSASPGGSLP